MNAEPKFRETAYSVKSVDSNSPRKRKDVSISIRKIPILLYINIVKNKEGGKAER